MDNNPNVEGIHSETLDEFYDDLKNPDYELKGMIKVSEDDYYALSWKKHTIEIECPIKFETPIFEICALSFNGREYDSAKRGKDKVKLKFSYFDKSELETLRGYLFRQYDYEEKSENTISVKGLKSCRVVSKVT